MSLKTGRLTKEEKRTILELSEKLTAQEIADRLGRRLVNIEKFLEENGQATSHIEDDDDKRLLKLLHDRPYWEMTKLQFSDKELTLFELSWIRLYKQFAEDVEWTEEQQICNLIKVEILAHRNLIERNATKREMEELQKRKDEIIEEHGPPPHEDADVNIEYQNLVGEMRSVEISYSSRMNEYKEILAKIATFTKELKGTREQRVEAIRKSKKDWVSLMKGIKEEKFRNKEGRELELMKLAKQKEKERLAEFHNYADQTVDRPLLTPETV